MLFSFALGMVGYLLTLAVSVHFALFTEGPPDDTIGAGVWMGNVCALVLSFVIVLVALHMSPQRRARSIGLYLSALVGVVLFTGTTIVGTELRDDFHSGCPCDVRVIDYLRADGWPGTRPV